MKLVTSIRNYLAPLLFFSSTSAIAGACGGIDHPSVQPHYTDYGLLGQYRAVCRLETQQTNSNLEPIQGNITLTKDVLWVLRDYVQVGVEQTDEDLYLSPITSPGSGGSAVLTIEAGTTIVGDGRDDVASSVSDVSHQNINGRSDGLIIARGSQIIANGTEDEPIVFTSIQELIEDHTLNGQWGGIAIQGYSYATGQGASCSTCEYHDPLAMLTYAGGVNPEISGGSLNYVSIRYAGKGQQLPGPDAHPALLLSYVGDTTSVGPVHVHDSELYTSVPAFRNDNFSTLDVSNVVVTQGSCEAPLEGDWVNFGFGCLAVPMMGMVPSLSFAGILLAISAVYERRKPILELAS